MGILGASIAAAIRASAAASAKGAAKATGASSSKGSSSRGSSSSGSSSRGSSSSSSGSSSRGSSSSGGSYTPKGTHNDATIRGNSADQTAQLQKYKDDYAAAAAKGDKAGMDAAHKAAESLRSGWGYSGGEDGSDYISTGGISGANLGEQMANRYSQGYSDYEQKMNDAAAAQQKALQASIDSAVNNLESQKTTIGKNTEANNAAAEKAYMLAINPNGSYAEGLASQGLSNSGITESSMISAGNTYQNALNSNATTQSEALAEIERAITQARLNGDIEKANALANLYKETAAKQLENVDKINSAYQWGQQFGLSQAEQTGTYNGQATLAARQLEIQKQQVEEDIANGKIDRETARKQLQYIQAQIDNLNAETEGQKLTNKYYSTQF
ncbi:hypothetical protein [Agathobaculum sp.]|uniref:hypothetical protein n=1 Tax=Agathobaculum sp. TaxID=2048138 RepID=UPI003AB30E5F